MHCCTKCSHCTQVFSLSSLLIFTFTFTKLLSLSSHFHNFQLEKTERMLRHMDEKDFWLPRWHALHHGSHFWMRMMVAKVLNDDYKTNTNWEVLIWCSSHAIASFTSSQASKLRYFETLPSDWPADGTTSVAKNHCCHHHPLQRQPQGPLQSYDPFNQSYFSDLIAVLCTVHSYALNY